MSKNLSYNASKYFYYIAVLVAPYGVNFGVNFGLIDIFLIMSGTALVLSGHKFKFPDRIIMFALLCILTGYSLSITNSVYPIEALKFPLQFVFVVGLVFPLTYTIVDSKKDVLKIAILLSTSIVTISMYGIYYYTIYGVSRTRDRWTLFYSGPGHLSTVLLFVTVIVLFLGAYYYLNEGKLGFLIISFTFSMVGIALIIRTLSRRSLIAISLVVLVIYITRFGLLNNKCSILKRCALFVPLISVLYFTLQYFNYIPQGIMLRIEETINYQDDTSTFSRIMQHRIGFRSLKDYWLIGTGYNNFVVAAEHATTIEEVSYMDQSHPRVHNAWLNPYIEGGVLAGIGILLLFGSVVHRTIKTWLLGINSSYLINFSFGLVTSAYLFVSVFGTLSNSRFIWLMMALSLVSLNIILNNKSE